ncbi:hypothetical protein H072_728 [Dactylellina haptotyla CBS 200.50]|uniref:Uncharacterized protein n=1 Tax=Dactylellina haptotyla (strain CBS 200.50) TaxID=1284197 RepID=S8C0K4_DACHA|nr:hypothetical protein H072_728 [Dactylellina haptotyla CBS 200.50]
MGTIELQIGHAKTPIPFMVPFIKAKNPEKLRNLILQRTGCDESTKVTLYNRALKVIHWDDWEDIIEPDKYYMADLNDGWVKRKFSQTVGAPVAGPSQFEEYLGGFTAPVGADIAPTKSTTQVQIEKKKHAANPPTKQAPIASSGALSEMGKMTRVLDPIVDDLEKRFVRMEATSETPMEGLTDSEDEEEPDIRPEAANKMIPPPMNLASGHQTIQAKYPDKPTKQQNLSSSSDAEPAMGIRFVPGTETYSDIQDNLVGGRYSKEAAKQLRPSSSHKSAATNLSKSERSNTPSANSSRKNKIRFRLIKPSQKNKPDPPNSKKYLIGVSVTTTPERIIVSLGKNPLFTSLVVLQQAEDGSKFYPTEVITPGSHLATTAIQDLGWGDRTIFTWEHVENGQEKERRNPNNIWEDVSGSEEEGY